MVLCAEMHMSQFFSKLRSRWHVKPSAETLKGISKCEGHNMNSK